MTTIEIKHRITGTVLFSHTAEDNTIRLTLQAAVAARAYLAGADLARADLADANLADANLAGANLADANLAGADLARADLARADLADANLADAYLAGADLARADLADANLADANLADAYLAGADLAGAYLADAYLAGANLAGAKNLPADIPATRPAEPYQRDMRPAAQRQAERAARFRERNPEVPVVEALDAKILERIQGGAALEMGSWHTCETTHCRAGWAVHMAGEAGYALERQYGPQQAGRMIYVASVGRVPHFFASNERAMEDLREQAAIQTAAAQPQAE